MIIIVIETCIRSFSGATTLSITTFSIMAISATLSFKRPSAIHFTVSSAVMLSAFMLSAFMLSAFMLSAFMLSDIMLLYV